MVLVLEYNGSVVSLVLFISYPAILPLSSFPGLLELQLAICDVSIAWKSFSHYVQDRESRKPDAR